MIKTREKEKQEKEIQQQIRGSKKRRTDHAKVYRPIHKQLELVWASIHTAGCFSYENNY
jgi:hypothetical protein